MPARILFASLVLLAVASPAFANPHGGRTYFFGLTWGHAPAGGVAPRGCGGSPFAAQPFGVQPFATQPFSVQPFAVQPFSVQPFSVQPFSVAPFSAQPNAQAEAQAFGNWLALVRQGCQIIGGGQGGGGQGGSSADFNKLNSSIQGLKTEIAELRKTNDKILLELTQIRKGDKSPPPEPKAQGGAKDGDENNKLDGKSKPASGPTYAAVDKQLNDLATSRKLIDAQRAAAKAKTPVAPNTSVAGNR